MSHKRVLNIRPDVSPKQLLANSEGLDISKDDGTGMMISVWMNLIRMPETGQGSAR